MARALPVPNLGMRLARLIAFWGELAGRIIGWWVHFAELSGFISMFIGRPCLTCAAIPRHGLMSWFPWKHGRVGFICVITRFSDSSTSRSTCDVVKLLGITYLGGKGLRIKFVIESIILWRTRMCAAGVRSPFFSLLICLWHLWDSPLDNLCTNTVLIYKLRCVGYCVISRLIMHCT
jgi:hypothetical protein